MEINTVCVYCASSNKVASIYGEVAYELGATLAKEGIDVVTGAGGIGLMRQVEDGALDNGGKAIGVIPQFMVDQEWHHTGLTELHITKDMHERKNLMYSLSDGFIALPGGIGTMEEITEIYTWRQLGYHDKNIALLNVNGFWDAFVEQMDSCVKLGFLTEEARAVLMETSSTEDILDLLAKESEELPDKL